MTKQETALTYLDLLEQGKTNDLLQLFSAEAMVDSPVYGLMKPKEFFRVLDNDTANSELRLSGIFEENNSQRLALYFNYKWTLKNNKKVEFDVVDIMEFDALNKIVRLSIIYDTAKSRKLVSEL